MAQSSTRTAIGHTILRFEEVESTNLLALENAEYLGNNGLVLLARHQTGGRGRMGRRYASVPGSQLQFSVVLHPRCNPELLGLTSLVAGVAVAQALRDVMGVRARLKWPNDVYLGSRKVSGILVELKSGTEPGNARMVVGIGINCNGHSSDFPPDLHQVLTTIQEESGEPVDTELLLSAVLERLAERLAELETGNQERLISIWRSHADYAERPVQAAHGREWIEGVVEDISMDGELVIRLPNGARHLHSAGEVRWLA